jgi:thiol-disulfide isomerase/thioredoxin
MLKSLLLLAPLLLLSTPASAQGPTLKPGDAAPALQVKQWVKGEAVKGFDKGKIYVVEFWATWCGPCKASIPHLTELAKSHKDVTFVGVSVWEDKQDKVAPFVEEMGAKMEYRVAMDDVPEGGKSDAGAMATNWMKASGSGGIPTAFIVDKTGHIAWIGHPMKMEEPLDQIVAGKWDLAAYQKQKAEEDALAGVSKELNGKLGKLLRGKEKDFKGAIAAMDEAFAKTPKLEENFGYTKFRVLLDSKDYDAGYAYGAKLVDGTYKNMASQLNGIAWSIVDPANKTLEKRDLKLALKAALRANELSKGKDAAILDTLAKVYFDSGDAAKAIETQTKALELVKGSDSEKEYQGRLDEYKSGKPAGT